MERDILHLTVPAYAVAVARVADPALRGRPVAIAPGLSDRAIISSVSAEAGRDGVLAGMSVLQGRRLCPALLTLPPNPQLLGRADRALQKLAGQYSPLVENQPAGRLFLDLTGSRRLLGPGRDIAMRLERELETQLRLVATLGVAGNKLVSKIAAEYLERPGVCDILRGSEQTFIAPLPVRVLPGIGNVREQLLLRELNLRRVSELAALQLPQLRLVFGPFAPLVRQRALGQDLTPVLPPRRSPEISAESYLSRAENDTSVLQAELCRLVEDCGLRLRRLGRACAELQLTIHYADGRQQSRTQQLRQAQNHDLLLYQATAELFAALNNRRTRLKGLKLSCRQLENSGQQGHLFAASGPAPRQQALQQALDRIRSKYGMRSICSGRTLAV